MKMAYLTEAEIYLSCSVAYKNLESGVKKSLITKYIKILVIRNKVNPFLIIPVSRSRIKIAKKMRYFRLVVIRSYFEELYLSCKYCMNCLSTEDIKRSRKIN